jgi:hypothetical protein
VAILQQHGDSFEFLVPFVYLLINNLIIDTLSSLKRHHFCFVYHEVSDSQNEFQMSSTYMVQSEKL